MVSLGIVLALLFYGASGPRWKVATVNVEYQPTTRQLTTTIYASYTGGCPKVLLEQWIEHEGTGQILSIFNYTGPPRVLPGFNGPITDVAVFKENLTPGYWIFDMNAICFLRNGSQEAFRTPTTRFLVQREKKTL